MSWAPHRLRSDGKNLPAYQESVRGGGGWRAASPHRDGRAEANKSGLGEHT